MRTKVHNLKHIAIVMGRNYASRLGMIRAAAESGCDVIVIQTGRNTKCRIDASSKYVLKTFIAKEPDHAKLVNIIKSLENVGEKRILLPTDDYTASVIDLHLDELKQNFMMPNVSRRQGELVRMMNKFRVKQIAKDAGLRVADGWVAHCDEANYIIPDGISYPCFIKPKESFKRALKRLMTRCNNERELALQLKRISEISKDDILIEELIDIDQEIAVLGVSVDGKSIIPGIISIKEHFLGVAATGTVCSITSYPGLEEKLTAFMEKINLTGLFDIDLFVSNGTIYFNELNLRLGASGYAITKSIINLPGVLINTLLGINPKAEFERSFPQYHFINEKTALSKVFAGQWTFSRFSEELAKANVTFILDDTDNKPYSQLKLSTLKRRVMTFVKKCFRIK